MRSTHPWLPSKMVQCATVAPSSNFIISEISLSKDCIGMSCLIAWDRAMYSALVVLSAISVCSLDAHNTGQLAKHMT
jgi:hypothetical protein